MGAWLSGPEQPKEIRRIYFSSNQSVKIDRVDRHMDYVVSWPDRYETLVEDVYRVTGKRAKHFVFMDGTKCPVLVCEQSTYEGLVPKHKSLDGKIELYYVVIVC